MIEIDSIWINTDVVTSKFCCNLNKCKGICCCLEGGKGAPVEESEVEILQEIYPIIKSGLNSRSRDIIEKYGFVEKEEDQLYLNCIDNKDCIFVYYDKNIAKCVLEKFYNEGKINWKKPISCHLYPIRINRFGGDVLRYSRISECKDAVKNGNDKNILLIDFLKEPLERKYGKNWYIKLKTEVQKYI